MIEIFRYNNKWRIKIINETFQFQTQKEFMESLQKIVKLKETKEPNKQ